jgi:hypothetical protein
LHIRRAKWLDHLFTIITGVAVLGLYVALNDPISRDIRSWYDGTGIAPDIPLNASIDEIINAAMPAEGNIVLDLPALVREPGVPPDSVGRIFARGTYLIWPRRFYAVSPENTVVWAREMQDMHTPDDLNWLAGHNVHEYARIYVDPTRIHRAPIVSPGTTRP